MNKKYWVPSLEKANSILNAIAYKPGKLRLIDIANKTSINKSSLYSLLNTLECIGWVRKESDTYFLGEKLFSLSSLYSKGSNLVNIFLEESTEFVDKLKETMQVSKLDVTETLYLAKKEGNSSVRLTTEPGMKMPAHATAMGKVLLSKFNWEELVQVYADKQLKPLTPNTVENLKNLYRQILTIKKNGHIKEYGEAVEGFNCISSPIYNLNGEIIAATSVTIPTYDWREKEEEATKSIEILTNNISLKLS